MIKTFTIDTDKWRLVPVEPTRDMVVAGTHQRFRDSYDAEEDCYRAMIAAAPQPEPVDGKPVEYLLDGARFKLSFQEIECDECGTESPYVLVTPLDQYANELNGKWVALVQAENDRHLHMTPPPDRTAELEAALEAEVMRLRNALETSIIRGMWSKATKLAKVENAHFHDIRAKAATDAKKLGMDYQKLLGHTNKAMSDRYIRLREVDEIAPLPKKVGAKL